MFFYAQLDEENYCSGISSLSGEVDYPNMIRIESMDSSYLGQLYDMENQQWTGEYRPEPEPQENHDDTIRNEIVRELIESDSLR